MIFKFIPEALGCYNVVLPDGNASNVRNLPNLKFKGDFSGYNKTRQGRCLVMIEKVKRGKKFVAALDVGTTTIRCHIYNEKAETIGIAVDRVELIYPQLGFVEIDNERLWDSIVSVIKEAIKDAGLEANEIACLGISVQRASFTTWNKDTGTPFHNIITWRDIRAEKIVHNLNKCLLMKSLRILSKFLYYLTGNERFLLGSQFKITSAQVTPRLLWHLQNNYLLKEAVENNCACFGTLDTWIIYRLTGGKLHATDVSNASCTGFFDPFAMSWAFWAFHIFHIPPKILPRIMDTADDFGCTIPDLFGACIPIRSCVADQSASLFGNCAFDIGDIKITLGTGSFVDVNTGDRPHASITGIYPVLGWRIKDEIVYVAEASSSDTGSIINWAQKVGIIKNPSESSDIAKSVGDTNGVHFIPSSTGLQAPINDGLASSGFVGIEMTTSKAHMVRAILESIAFKIQKLLQVMKTELQSEYELMRIDGGVSRNDFLCQLIADLAGTNIERATTPEMSVLGAAFMAGMSIGVWKTKEELSSLRKVGRIFRHRQKVKEEYRERVKQWENALNKFLHFYPENEC